MRYGVCLIAVLVLYACSGGGSTHRLYGTIEVPIASSALADRCGAITRGAVTVRDDAGRVIATGETHYTGIDKSHFCGATFSLPVPTAKFYQIQVAGYIAPIASFESLQARQWRLTLLWL